MTARPKPRSRAGRGVLAVPRPFLKWVGGKGQLLGDLIALYREGWEHPLPVPCETGFTWQRNIGSGWGRARYRAGQQWDGTFGENKDSANVLLLQAGSIDHLLDAGLEDYCTRLWAPLFGLMGEKQL